MTTSTEVSVAIELSPRYVRQFLVGTSIFLAIVSYSAHLVARSRDADSIALLDVGDEVSIGTWFETLLFACAALALLFGGRATSTFRSRWYVLAAVMMLLSIDEAASMHERLGSGLRDVVGASGILYYVWVIPALVFVAILAVYEIPWLRSLPPTTARRVVVAGALFVAGAAFLELAAGPEAEAKGTDTLLSISLTGVEELLEMIGLSLFIFAIVDHLSGRRLVVDIA